MPYEPFLLRVGVLFNVLKKRLTGVKTEQRMKTEQTREETWRLIGESPKRTGQPNEDRKTN